MFLENANDAKVPAVNDAYHSARYERFSLFMKGPLTTIIIARDELIASLSDLSTFPQRAELSSLNTHDAMSRATAWEKRETEIHT